MYMSPDVIGTIVAVFGAAAALLAAVYAMLRQLEGRMDAGFHSSDERINVLGTEVRAEVRELRTELKEEIGELRTELKQEIGELRTELKQEIGELRTELKQEIGELRTEIHTVAADVVSLKVSVARLEGPTRRLLQPH